MSYALSSGVSGLLAHQEMLDVAGNNLANVNTTAFKSSSVSFSEVLGQTVQSASQATSTRGGTNPSQIGGGVGVASIKRNMSGGSIVDSDNPLDMAIDGEGYFVVNDGEGNVYTRAGTFSVDGDGYLVDTSSGYRVQRLGTIGEADGFQIAGNSSIRIPYDASLPAQQTTEVTLSGNLSSDSSGTPHAQVLSSALTYTSDDVEATDTTEIVQLDQFSGGSEPDGQLGVAETGTLTISGYHSDGTAFSTGLSFTVANTTTLGDLVTHLNTNVLSGSTASLVDGRIVITDNATGYSLSDITLSYAGTGTLETPPYFEMTTVGGDEVQIVNVTIYGTLGRSHVLSAALIRTESNNTWDMVLTSVTGDVTNIDMDTRRISGLVFDSESGAYGGISSGADPEFTVTFSHDAANPQTVAFDVGTVGSFNGLTQFAGDSTAVARDQDGYASGSLSSVSASSNGVLIGTFSNGIKKDLAALQVATFNNPGGLEGLGGGYYIGSANSGEAIVVQAGTGGAGPIQGSALEQSNADIASEFVNLIQAQNGYQANARTITVANEILQELTNLIR